MNRIEKRMEELQNKNEDRRLQIFEILERFLLLKMDWFSALVRCCLAKWDD